ncbi:MAG TPA: hypothetical protein VN767_08525 [Streptosporangiaceae bacterium]|nr:hypothetical protein [Streptosporangiaceae bacterium]
MKRTVRWCIAGLATAATFSAVTWIGGALALSALRLDSGARWGIAGGAGVAVAALTALWGHGFATRAEENADQKMEQETPATTSGGGNFSNEIKGGVKGAALQGRDIYGPVAFGGADPPRRSDLDEP